MTRILIAERIDDEGIKLLKNAVEIVHVDFSITREKLLNVIHKYDALIVRSSTKVDAELLEKGVNLKIVGRAGNGVDNIEVAEATKRGIIVANTPESNTMSACELTIGLLLAQARNISQANSYIKSGKWKRNMFKGVELYNKTIGIIGLGRIGSLVATRMAAFGMKVIAYDPYILDERFKRFNAIKKDNLKELIMESDFITVHTPKTKETTGIIGIEELEYMKDGVRIVNAARGGIICEKALLKGLKDGKIASVGLDVHECEPCFDNPLFEFDNVIVTPHIGASTIEAQENVGITVANQVLSGLKGEIVTNAVNLPALHRDELLLIKPYIELMEKLGKIYYQLNSEPIDFVEVDYFGNISSQDTEMITIAFIKGLLEPVVKENVNYINARIYAENRDIVISERKTPENYNNYVDLICVKIKSKNSTFTLSGSLSAKKEGKLVEIQGHEVDVNPSEYMLIIQNLDVPGVIGNIGMVLGEDNINVATMQVGRNVKGENAMMILNVDDDVCEASISKLCDVKNVLSAKVIKL